MNISYIWTALLILTLVNCRKSLPIYEQPVIDTEAFHNRRIGESSSELLSDSIYKSLMVEIQYVEGYKPDVGTLEYLQTFLYTYLKKPNGINILLREIPAIEQEALSMEEVLAIEKENRNLFVKEDKMAMYILITNGVHPGNKILGMAYRNTSAVVYGKAIKKYSSSGKLPHKKLETAVLLHEIGHLLGLVNKGSTPRSIHVNSTFHDHCNNRKCLMYHSVETKSFSSILMKGNIPVLDSRCVEDLIANGGKNTPDYHPYIKPF
jgi:hypothetical protein